MSAVVPLRPWWFRDTGNKCCTDLLEGSSLERQFDDGRERDHDDRATRQHPAHDDGPAGVVVGPVIGQLRVTVGA